MERLKLMDLLNHSEKILIEKQYSEKTINDYKYVWNKFYDFCEVAGIEYFDLDIAKKFLEKYYHIDLKNGKGRLYTRRMRSILFLNSVDENKEIRNFRPKIDKIIPEEYKDIYYEYDNYLKENYNYSTLMTSASVIGKFLNYLDSINVNSIQDISIQNIYAFVNIENTKNYSKTTMYEIKYKLKKFFQYLYLHDKYRFSGNDIFPRIAKYDRAKLPSHYTIEEINLILNQVNRETKRGKRDFAILLLAIVYGLRNSDIVHLEKKNILWNANKIELIQYKTKKLLELPLTENVKFALLDYLKNARPNVNSPYVFLPTKPPYSYIGKDRYSSLYKSFEYYLKKSRIDIKGRKKGLHALRHSMASNMLKNNTEIYTISNVLGHSNIDVTNIYLSIDEKHLKKLALEVPDYE